MKLGTSLRMSWRAIWGHKLRSTLTTLGIIIGIGAVIAFMILGTSFKADVVGDISQENEPVLLAYTQTSTEGGGVRIGDSPTFTERDIRSIEELDGVDYVVPSGQVQVVQTEYAGRTVTGTIQYEATSRKRFANASFAEGRAFTPGEREAVINQQVNLLFESNISAGDNITVYRSDGEATNVTVVGVLNESLQVSLGPGQPRIYLPTDPFYETRIRDDGNETQKAYPVLRVRVERLERVDDTRGELEDYLANRSDAREHKPEGYEFQVQTEQSIVSQVEDILNQITALITGIAAISLIVGSVGIANIMLVSVTERTREIGIMKAIGARNRDVLQLFLVEAVIVGVIGSVLGTLLGVGGGYALTVAFGFPLTYPVEWFLIAIGIGVLVGIVAGIYPAWRAARTDPIDALRYE